MRLYHAKAGQTLAQIALETGFTYTALKEANPLYPVPVMWDYKKMVSMYYKIQGK